MDPGRRSSEVQLLGDRHEVFKLAEFHLSILSMFRTKRIYWTNHERGSTLKATAERNPFGSVISLDRRDQSARRVEMKRAAVLLLQMHQVSQAIYLGRTAMTPDEAKDLWAKYQEAEAELHWIIPPAVEPMGGTARVFA